MKLTHVIPAFFPATAYGGPPNTTFALGDELGKLGHDILVLTTNANGLSTLPGLTGGPVQVGGHTKAIYCPRLFGDSVSPALISTLLRHVLSADTVMLSGVYSFPTIPTLLAARLWSKRVLWLPHGAFTEWQGGRRDLLKRIWRAACRLAMPRNVCFVVSSDAERAGVLSRFPDAEVAVVPFGIAPPDGCGYRRRRESGGVRLLYLGRLHPIKGLDNTLEALRQLKAGEGPDWSLTIAGAGAPEYESHLRDLVTRAGLSARVRFAGYVDGEAKREVLAGHDVLLFPSYKESFGLSVLEALSYGLVVVAGSGTPWHELADEKLGFCVDNDPASLSAAIVDACKMAKTGDGERAGRWVAERYGIARSAEAMAARLHGPQRQGA